MCYKTRLDPEIIISLDKSEQNQQQANWSSWYALAFFYSYPWHVRSLCLEPFVEQQQQPNTLAGLEDTAAPAGTDSHIRHKRTTCDLLSILNV